MLSNIIQPGDPEFFHPGRKGMLSKLFKRPWPPGFFWPECPCCDTGDCPSCGFCLDDLSPQIFQFSISGVEDDVGSNCDDYNGTWQVECETPTDDLCEWWSEEFAPGGEPRYILQIKKAVNPVAQIHWVQYQLHALGFLGFGGPLFAFWTWDGPNVPDTDPLELVDCMVSHNLEFRSNSTACKTWPSIVAVAPV